MRSAVRFRPAVLTACVVALFAATSPPLTAAPPPFVDVLISFKNAPGPDEHAVVRQQGGAITETYWLVPAVAARVPAAAVAAIGRNPLVDVIEPDAEVLAHDLELDNAWGVARIGAGLVHDAGQSGAGIKVAVLDTGIDYTHPDLDANVVGGWDFVNNDADPMDDHSHGTHIAGTIGAEDNGAGVVGVAPGVQLYALKVLGANGSGSWSHIISALQWCVNNGMHVTNNSYGSATDPGSTVRQAYANAYAAGVLIVASAGNSGTSDGNTDTVGYPARYDSVIAVGATTSSDTRPSWSSTGPTVELAAPGSSIYSTLPGGRYGGKSGTSMACPHVVGAAALVMATGVTDIVDVRQVLAVTSQDLGASGWDTWYGFGLVDAAAAFSLARTAPAPAPAPEPDPEPTPPAPSAVFVHSIQYSTSGGRQSDKHLSVAATLRNDLSGAVAGATVTVSITRDQKVVLRSSGTTDSAGKVSFSLTNAPSGTYQTLVQSVSAGSLVWDGVTPANSYKK